VTVHEAWGTKEVTVETVVVTATVPLALVQVEEETLVILIPLT
jgi:hypothetical protein